MLQLQGPHTTRFDMEATLGRPRHSWVRQVSNDTDMSAADALTLAQVGRSVESSPYGLRTGRTMMMMMMIETAYAGYLYIYIYIVFCQ